MKCNKSELRAILEVISQAAEKIIRKLSADSNSIGKKKKKANGADKETGIFYAVAVGRKTGIFNRWEGPNGAQVQVVGYSGALHKKFKRRDDAESYLDENEE